MVAMERKRQNAFTLVELLIVIAILSLLMQLILPAVEMSREAARRTACSNNLRQVALAFQLHEGAQKHLPTGGWGWNWMGDPERGFNQNQPGGWGFNILPFIEQGSLRNLALGSDGEKQKLANRQLVATPLKVFVCPSRRLPRAYPYTNGVNFPLLGTPELCARSDYAANLGMIDTPKSSRGPKTYEEADLWQVGDTPNSTWEATKYNGVVFQRSRVELQQITDGLSNTLMVAEKYIEQANYKNGASWGDNEHLYMGYDHDLLRSTHSRHYPIRDADSNNTFGFGSAHLSTFQAAFCDGSVRALEYEIDPKVFGAYGDRGSE